MSLIMPDSFSETSASRISFAWVPLLVCVCQVSLSAASETEEEEGGAKPKAMDMATVLRDLCKVKLKPVERSDHNQIPFFLKWGGGLSWFLVFFCLCACARVCVCGGGHVLGSQFFECLHCLCRFFF